MAIVSNPYRAGAAPFDIGVEVPFPSTDAGAALALLFLCPAHGETPLQSAGALARDCGVAEVHIKDECGRMGLGSFKALGAAYVIASEADKARKGNNWSNALADRAFVTASAGNHGMSVAAGARIFGARAVIYLAETVPESFAKRLRGKGAEVRREGAEYEASMAAAARAAESEGLTLLSDSSWPGYFDLPHRLMEGYLAMADEISRQMAEAPTHVFLQAGVGGLAGAVAAHVRKVWGDEPVITVVEPEAAPALLVSIEAGRFAAAHGPVSNMGRLDCKEASLIALKGLARDADFFVTVSDEAALAATNRLVGEGIATTPSGAAGVAALLDPAIRQAVGAGAEARVLTIVSEGSDG